MNVKRQQAALHARELRMAKEALLQQVNIKLQSYREQGYEAQAVPQIERLIALDKYRSRDVAKMRQLAMNPEKLNDYIFAVNPANEVVVGEKAIERYLRYASSSIYKASDYDITQYIRGGFYALPKEADIMIQNVSEEVEKAFVDESTLHAFRQFLTDLTNDPQGTSGDMAFILHPEWRKLNSARQYYAVGEMVTANVNNLFTMHSALESLVQKEGTAEVARRIAENWDVLQEECITATIGYKSAASMAMQTVLRIFLPSDRQPGNIRHRISDMQDMYDSQFDDYEE